MKRILFPTLLIATLLAGGLVAFAIWRTSPASAEDYLKSGRELFEAQKYQDATIQLLNAVQVEERNRDARYLLVLSYINQGDLGSAVKQLRALLEYFPNDQQAKIQLGSLYIRGNSRDIEEGKKIAKGILDADPSNIEALMLWGSAATALKDYETSVQAYEKVISLDPKSIPAYVNLGMAQFFRKNYQEAEQALLKARDIDPKNRSALLPLANYYRSINQPKKAEEIFKAALELFPEDPLVYAPLAGLYHESGRFDEAVRLLNAIQAKNLKDPRPSIMLSDLLMLKGQESDARRVLLDAKKDNPVDKDHPGGAEIAGKLAVMLMRSDPSRAREEIDQILKLHPKNPRALVLLGENQYWSGQLDEAKATLNNPEALNSTLPEAHYFLGVIAVRQGDFDAGEEHYRKALLVNSGHLPTRSALAGLLVDKGRLTDARVEVGRVLEINKNYVPARLVKAAIDMKEQRYEGVELELNSMLKEQPNNSEIHGQLGAFYAARNRNADAEKAFVRGLELQPDSIERLRALSQFYVQTKQGEKAVQRLSVIPEDKKTAAHYEMLGSIYTQMGKPQESETAYMKALEKDPKSNADAAITANYINSGRTEEGLKKLDELIKKNPANGGAHMLKGMIYEKQGKLSDAKQSYARALQIDGNLDAAANNYAYLLAEEGRDLDTALTWAQSARKRQPDLAGVADTLGWVYHKIGNHALALAQLQVAASKEPTNPVFQYHLGMIYIGNKQPREAADALRKAVNSTIDYKEKALAQAALKEVTK